MSSTKLSWELADFPFDSQFVDIRGSRLHYIQKGTGNPILFLHGNPTWSYLWRNVLPHISSYGQCLAVDLIGFGQSDQPDIEYKFEDHFQYIDEFIEKLDLRDLVIVGHDWGAAIGLRYAMENPGRVAGFSFMEAAMPPVFPKESWADLGEFESLFRDFRDPIVGKHLIEEKNEFIDGFLPRTILRDLSDQEQDAYRKPFDGGRTRKPISVWPRELPIEGSPENNRRLFEQMSQWLIESELPKLLIHASPGIAMPKPVVQWAEENLINLEVRHVGNGLHYIQEDCPNEIGNALANWISQTIHKKGR